jgi:hypothetical protein
MLYYSVFLWGINTLIRKYSHMTNFKLALFNLRIALYSNQFGFQLALALSSLMWAALTAWTLIPVDGLALVSPAQDFLTRVAPQSFWVTVFAIQGIVGLVSVLFNVRNNTVAVLDKLLGAVLWNVTTAILVIGYLYEGRNIPPVWSTHITLSLISIWLLLRTSDEVK